MTQGDSLQSLVLASQRRENEDQEPVTSSNGGLASTEISMVTGHRSPFTLLVTCDKGIRELVTDVCEIVTLSDRHDIRCSPLLRRIRVVTLLAFYFGLLYSVDFLCIRVPKNYPSGSSRYTLLTLLLLTPSTSLVFRFVTRFVFIV